MFRNSRARALVLGATTLAALGAIDAQALPYNANAGYQVDATTVNLPAQSSATGVDILEFTTVGNVGVGIHAYGAGGSFGSRASADFFGTGKALVDSLFELSLAGLGSSIDLNVTPGEVAVHGPAGGFAQLGDGLLSEIIFVIQVDGSIVYHSAVSASIDSTSAAAGQQVFFDAGVALNLGLSCSHSLVDGEASCIIGGGNTTLALDTLAGHGGLHSLQYDILAFTQGDIHDFTGCGGSGGGGGEVLETAAIVEGGGNNGGGKLCGGIARSGDPVPEPATFALAPLAVAGAALARRRQRRAA